MGTSLIVRVRPEGVELTQAAIQQLAQSISKAARETSASAAVAVSQHASEMGDRYARATLRITEATARVASSAEVMGHGLNRVVAIGSEMAFAFGAAGPIVGAIGIATLAITRMFTRAREEAEKTRAELQEQFKQIAKLGVSSVADALNEEGPKLEAARKRMLEAKAKADSLVAHGISGAVTGGTIQSAVDEANEAQKAFNRQKSLKNALDARLRLLVEQDSFLARSRGAEAPVSEWELWRTPEINSDALSEMFRRALAEKREVMNPSWASKSHEELNESAGGFFKGQTDQMLKNVAASIAADAPKLLKGMQGQLQEQLKQFKWTGIKNDLASGIASSVAGGLAAGIQAAVATSDLSSAFGQLGKFITSQLGQVLADVALKAVGFAELMADFESFLVSNPWAAIGIAAAMVALANVFKSGGSVGAGGGGYRGYGGYGSHASAVGAAETTRVLWGADSTAVAAGMTPVKANQFVIIGVDDAKAQAALLQMIRKAERRG